MQNEQQINRSTKKSGKQSHCNRYNKQIRRKTNKAWKKQKCTERFSCHNEMRDVLGSMATNVYNHIIKAKDKM